MPLFVLLAMGKHGDDEDDDAEDAGDDDCG